MERSTDRYLHKKFKKQLNIEVNNVQKEEKTREMRFADYERVFNDKFSLGENAVPTGVYLNDIPVQDYRDNVPIISTNNKNTFSGLESSKVFKSSISHRDVVNAVEQNLRNANVAEDDSERGRAGELVDPQSSNSCISYVISKSSRIDNYTQREPQFRSVNFDTRFNVSEPIAIPAANTSSILDNVYSKQYVTSKLVNVERAGDISSNSVINDHGTNHEECINNNRNVESKVDNHLPEFNTSEKSSTGKYICSYCNLACSKPSVLQKHIRAHTNERPYPCVSCGFSFKTRSNLYKHCRSRTHANRVMGNKAQELHNEIDVDSQNKIEYNEQNNSIESVSDDCINRTKEFQNEERSIGSDKASQDNKCKPYKPRFHTAKTFFEDTQKNSEGSDTVHNRPSNSTLLSLHINEVINKNNAIVNSNESYLIKKRSIENSIIENVNSNDSIHRQNEIIYPHQQTHIANEERIYEEPLNLTNKCRKRCLSEVGNEPAIHTSLIKELLLKNLSVDSMQCPHCKMIFQTVTELELHKFRSCKGFIKSGARYSRSSSVNVASILTKNKNAFDNIPHLQNTVFPLKSPGPFLGKTRLVESDKSKSFSFDDSLTNFSSNYHSTSEFLKTTLRYSLSPLTVQHDKVKRVQPVKLFGGQVKITQNTGETKSFKMDKDYDKYGGDSFDYANSLSENRVVISNLQSGGTILQNKSNYIQKQETLRSSPDVIRLYENSSISPNIDILSLEKNKFTFERLQNQDLECEKNVNSEQVSGPTNVAGQINLNNSVITSYKYTNIMDFSQNAVKQITPNIRQPNLTVPGVPAPNKLLSRSSSLGFEPTQSPLKVFDSNSVVRTPVESARVNVINFSEVPRTQETETRHFENIQFAQKQIVLQQSMAKELSSPSTPSPNLCNPVNLLVNGKVVRYVPGIPGPIVAEVPPDVAYGGNQQRTVVSQMRTQKPSPIYTTAKSSDSSSSLNNVLIDKTENRTPSYNGSLNVDKKHIELDRTLRSPKFGALEINVNEPSRIIQLKSPSIKSMETKLSVSKNDMKSPNNLAPPSSSISDGLRKFARPNTLALKPSIAAQKQHHGLTPTMFNQILISPDTPRVAKKYMQHFLHGNYFSYLGLKSSTKPVYCTLNKTQPFYVPHHFMKLSMYSEWRQQDIKGDKLYASAYDSRQHRGRYVTAGSRSTDLVVHSSYKFVVNETISGKCEDHKANSILGGYESNEDYTYVRGRGRGRYVCDQCGIRCKKPSMLKKHIRTHTNDRPYTCSHCNFSFKTKGNLTKHMKSKAHTKNYAASSSSSSSAQQSGTQSSESDTDDSGMDSSDESTRHQEHEAAYGLLSLSQKTTQNTTSSSHTSTSSSVCSLNVNSMENRGSFMNAEQVTQVNNSNFAKNKILDQVTVNFNSVRIINEISLNVDQGPKELQNLVQFLGKSNTSRPLTYPYTSDIMDSVEKSPSSESVASKRSFKVLTELSNTSEFNREQKSNSSPPLEVIQTKIVENKRVPVSVNFEDKYIEKRPSNEDVSLKHHRNFQSVSVQIPHESRKRKVSEVENVVTKLHRTESEAMDLSMPSVVQKTSLLSLPEKYNGDYSNERFVEKSYSNDNYEEPPYSDENFQTNGVISNEVQEINYQESEDDSQSALNLKTTQCVSNNKINVNYVYRENPNPAMITTFTEVPNSFSPMDYDNSAMETLADVATKQVKLEKDTLAKSVASEYLKFAKKQEYQANDGLRDGNFVSSSKEVNELMVKSEENKSCSICSKSFSKPSQLRLHMNIHYLERPFRCDPCSVSFRTKGHLQKHERSASHHNKLSSSPLLSSSEPRPFKCSDCNIAFRIHGHLAKHLRSKMHIMKLECLAKIPFGLYAELERANSLLTEINTTDGDQCLESLKILARKVFMNDPSKLNQLEVSLSGTDTSDS